MKRQPLIQRLILTGLLLFPMLAGGEAADSDVRAVEARWMRETVQALRFGLPDQLTATLQAAYESGGLPGWLMELDKNLLDSTEQDGLLFTQGTLDTLGVWIWQRVLGHRQDVTIIPLGLLNEPWFLLQLRENRRLHPAGAPVFWERTDILNRRTPPWNGQPLRLGRESSAKVLKVNDPEQSLQSGRVYTPGTVAALLHILESNGWDRPVLFSPYVKSGLRDALSPWLVRRGLGYALSASGNDDDWEATWLWARSASFEALSTAQGGESDSVAFYCARLHQRLADILKRQGRDQDAALAHARIQDLLNGRLLAPLEH